MTDLLPEVDLDPCSNPQSTVRLARPGKALSLEAGEDGLAHPWASVPLLMALPTGDNGEMNIERLYHWDSGEDSPSRLVCAQTAFVNPPYSNVTPWVRRAVEFARGGGQCLMLIKADATTRWWAEAGAYEGCSFRLFRRRIKFAGARSGATFPSALLLFEPPYTPVRAHFDEFLDRLVTDRWIW